MMLVIIEVRGGVIKIVGKPAGVAVRVIDWDHQVVPEDGLGGEPEPSKTVSRSAEAIADKIQASYTDKARTRYDGLENKECPLCGKVVLELDMEDYSESGTGREVECCNDCREDFERDTGFKLDGDVLEGAVFARLWGWAREALVSGGQVDH